MRTTRDDEIGALLVRVADGDRSAFSVVFRELWPRLHRFCTSLVGSEADAADAAQEAMTKILERAADYDRQRPPMAWALAIAAWECRTLKRKRTRRREAPEDAADERIGANSELVIEERDLVQAALVALGELSPTDRETLVATFLEESIQVSGATLRKRRERAVERLRSAFRRLYGLD